MSVLRFILLFLALLVKNKPAVYGNNNFEIILKLIGLGFRGK